MQGRIDTSFQTLQRDLFASGLASRIGMNAFGVWLAIKSHADYNSGKAWPGMRRLAELTGLAVGSVSKAVHVLVDAKLLRVLADGAGRRGNTYIARERLDVRLGERVLCSIVVDYVPATLRLKLAGIEQALTAGEASTEAFADCEILPGEGFAWDPRSSSLRAAIPVRDIPLPDLTEEELKAPLVQRVLAIQKRVKAERSAGATVDHS